MNDFNYRGGELYAEDCKLSAIAAQYGTPCYVYSRASLERQWRAFDGAFQPHPHLICYAVKANANLAVLNVLARLGSGFDIVSGGELDRVLAAGGEPDKVVFSGVGKSEAELRQALAVGIACFNVESDAELQRLNAVAQDMDKIAPIALRVNPDVDASTHPYIATGLKDNKFGIDISTAVELYQYAAAQPNLRLHGIACHIGSQLTTLAPILDALDRVLQLVNQLQQHGIQLQHIDIGGGLGIRYNDESPPTPNELATAVLQRVQGLPYSLCLEPGRAIVGNAGVLLTRVEYLKHSEQKNFAIVDAAMNDLLRPALYAAWQNIIPVVQNSSANTLNYDIVGPVCESGDFLGKQRPLALQANDLLAVCSAGAYGFSMSGNYNARPRAAEVMVDCGQAHLIRARETFADLRRGESLLP